MKRSTTSKTPSRLIINLNATSNREAEREKACAPITNAAVEAARLMARMREKAKEGINACGGADRWLMVYEFGQCGLTQTLSINKETGWLRLEAEGFGHHLAAAEALAWYARMERGGDPCYDEMQQGKGFSLWLTMMAGILMENLRDNKKHLAWYQARWKSPKARRLNARADRVNGKKARGK